MRNGSVVSTKKILFLLALLIAIGGCGGTGQGGGGGGGKTTPTMSYPTPASITYNTPLSSTQLDATCSVPGAITYSEGSTNIAIGTVLSAGNHTITATCSPNDTADYNTATATATLTVNKATPTVTWATPTAITYGTALSSTQLDATGSVSGAIAYAEGSTNITIGTVLSAGNQSLTATLTPTDATDYTTATAMVTLTVNKAGTTVTWGAPAAITYNTPLSSTQLDATGSVSGTITYAEGSVAVAIGAVLDAGSHSLTATLTPTDATDYNTATAMVTLTVKKATPDITWATPAPITSNQTLAGVLDATANTTGDFSYTEMPAGGGTWTGVVDSSKLSAGSYTLTVDFTPGDTGDYTTATATVALTVTQAGPTLTALDHPAVYCDEPFPKCVELDMKITGTGFGSGGTLSMTGWPTLTYPSGMSDTELELGIFFDADHITAGWKTFQFCLPDGKTCSNNLSFLLITINNIVAVDYQNKELYSLDESAGKVWKFKITSATGTPNQALVADGSFTIALGSNQIAFDTTTNYVADGDVDGLDFYSSTGVGEGASVQDDILGVATQNGTGCGTSSASSLLYCADETQFLLPYGKTAVVSPSAIAMGSLTVNGKTEQDALVLTRDGTPTLTRFGVNGYSNPTSENSLALTGATPLGSLPAFTGGWYETLTDSTSGTLFVADKLAIFVDAETMKEIGRTTLQQTGYLLAANTAKGTFVVQVPNLTDTTNPTSSFIAIDPATGKISQLTAHSSKFGGLAVSGDGTVLYVCSGSDCEVQPYAVTP